MTSQTRRVTLTLGILLAAAGTASAAPELITNGGFESGLIGWTLANQLGSDGQFWAQSGTSSPVNALPVAAPLQGSVAAMTDSAGPGSHVLYQDFVVPSSVPVATLQFAVFVHNYHSAFVTPSTLDFATTALNQQARVDLMLASASPFSMLAGDILSNLFRTQVGDPLVSGYTTISTDVTTLLAAHAGETLRLRFAQTDNVNIFNFGVDAVSLLVPAPMTGLLLAPLGTMAARRRRRA